MRERSKFAEPIQGCRIQRILSGEATEILERSDAARKARADDCGHDWTVNPSR